MLVEIICFNLLGLSVDLSKCSSTQLAKIPTLSGNQTLIFTKPIEQQIELAKGKPNESRYRQEADREIERREIENIRDRGYDNRRRIENNYEYYRYDRGRVESIRDRIDDIDDRIDDLEREKKRLEELERRYRRGYY